MKTKHTETPWFESVHDDNNERVIRAHKDSDYEPIICNCECDAPSSFDGEQIGANAAFIVRACNGWDDVPALRKRLAELEDSR